MRFDCNPSVLPIREERATHPISCQRFSTRISRDLSDLEFPDGLSFERARRAMSVGGGRCDAPALPDSDEIPHNFRPAAVLLLLRTYPAMWLGSKGSYRQSVRRAP